MVSALFRQRFILTACVYVRQVSVSSIPRDFIVMELRKLQVVAPDGCFREIGGRVASNEELYKTPNGSGGRVSLPFLTGSGRLLRYRC